MQTSFSSCTVWRAVFLALSALLSLHHPCSADSLGKEHLLLRRGPDVYALAFSPNGHTLASGGEDKRIRLWDVRTGKLLHTLSSRSSDVYSLCFSPNGRTLASGGADKVIRLWDARTGKPRSTYLFASTEQEQVNALAFSPDGRTLVSGSSDGVGSQGCLRFWRTTEGRPMRMVLAPTSFGVNSLDFSQDGKRLLVGSGLNDGESLDGEWALWNVVHPHATTIHHVASRLNAARFSPLGDYFVVGGEGGMPLQLWSSNGRQKKASDLSPKAVLSLAVSPDGKRIACGDLDSTLTLYDAHLHRIASRKLGGYVRGVCFSPDGHTLAVADISGAVRLFPIQAS